MPGFTEAVLCWLPAKTAIEAAGKVEEGSNPRVYRGSGVAPPRAPAYHPLGRQALAGHIGLLFSSQQRELRLEEAVAILDLLRV